MNTEIRNLREEDLADVVTVHVAAFPDGGLMMLGKEAMRRYYKWQLQGPHKSRAIGMFQDKEIVGFCFGGIFDGAISGFLRANRGFLFWRVLTHPWLIMNPIFRDRLKFGFRILKKFKKKVAPPVKTDSDYSSAKKFRILVVAVHPQHQGLGIGKSLLREMESEARQRGFQEMVLSVHTDNDPAIRCYESLAWERIVTGASWSGLMRKTLNA